MIYIGADHRGWQLKAKIKKYLYDSQYDFEDLGALSLDPNDDYPLIAEKVSQKVKVDENNFGILLCGSGAGVEIAANKIDGVRASLSNSVEGVKAARSDDNINILVIAADLTDEAKSKDLIKAFLETKYDKNEKHDRRLEEIKKIEENN